MRRQRFLLFVLIFQICVAGAALAAAQETIAKVTFLVFSDISEIHERNGRGGYARIAGSIQQERSKTRNLIVAHAGDAISPSLISGFDKGKHVIEILNLLKPDVFVPGNHEFDFGEAVFKQRMAEAAFSRLAANLRGSKEELLEGFSDHKIFTVDGVKIGVFGLTDHESAKVSNPGALKIRPLVPVAVEQAKKLKESGADIVVAVTHSDLKDDYRLLNSGLIDLILSGHDHNLHIVYNGQSAIAETQSDGMNVIAVDVTIRKRDDAAGKTSWEPRFRVIDTADVAPDPVVSRKIDDVTSLYDKQLDNEIGKTDVELDSRNASVRSRETAIGNFIADSMRRAAKADVALINGGSIRGNQIYPAGTAITMKTLLRELPFNSRLVTLKISGKDLRQALENAVWMTGKDDGRFGQISGMNIVVRSEAVPGSRLESVRIGGKKLNLNKSYKLATTDFLYQGKDGYDSLSSARMTAGASDGPLILTVVRDAIATAGRINPKTEGRIVFK